MLPPRLVMNWQRSIGTFGLSCLMVWQSGRTCGTVILKKTKKHLNVPVRYPKDWCGNKSRRHFRSNIIIYGASRMYIDAVQVVNGVSWLRV